jgi:hypothetical protein
MIRRGVAFCAVVSVVVPDAASVTLEDVHAHPIVVAVAIGEDPPA